MKQIKNRQQISSEARNEYVELLTLNPKPRLDLRSKFIHSPQHYVGNLHMGFIEGELIERRSAEDCMQPIATPKFIQRAPATFNHFEYFKLIAIMQSSDSSERQAERIADRVAVGLTAGEPIKAMNTSLIQRDTGMTTHESMARHLGYKNAFGWSSADFPKLAEVRKIIEVVKNDAESSSRLSSPLRYLPLAGWLRDASVMGPDMFTGNDPTPEKSKMICNGIEDATNAAILSAKLPFVRNVETANRQGGFNVEAGLIVGAHVATRVDFVDGQTIVFDWWATMNIDDPLLYPSNRDFELATRAMRFSEWEYPKKSGHSSATSVSELQHDSIEHSQPGEVPPIVHAVLRAPGEPLDAATRAFMELRFGQDFPEVRVHTDGRAADSARAVGALAYTVGRDVVFAAGQYAPSTQSGRRLLAHELTHVAHQRKRGDEASLSHEIEAKRASKSNDSESALSTELASLPKVLQLQSPTPPPTGTTNARGPKGRPLDPSLRKAIGPPATAIFQVQVGGAYPAGYPLVPGVYDGYLNLVYINRTNVSVIIERNEQLLEVTIDDLVNYIRLTPTETGMHSATWVSFVYPWLVKTTGELLISLDGLAALLGSALYKLGEAGIKEAAEAGIPEAIEYLECDEKDDFPVQLSVAMTAFKKPTQTDTLAQQQLKQFEKTSGLKYPHNSMLEAPWIGRGSRSTSEGWLRDGHNFWSVWKYEFKEDAKLLGPDNTVTEELARRWGWPETTVGKKLYPHHIENGPYVVLVPEGPHTPGTSIFKRIHRRVSFPKLGSLPKFRFKMPKS